jgi:hypothetical protein
MATVAVEGREVVVRMQGLDRILALKSELRVPLAHVRRVIPRPANIPSAWMALRVPGTFVPGVVTAGTYITPDGKVFFDVHDPHSTVEIDLHDEFYDKVIVQVENPEEDAGRIQRALGEEPGEAGRPARP